MTDQPALRIARAMRMLRLEGDSGAEALADALWLANILPRSRESREEAPPPLPERKKAPPKEPEESAGEPNAGSSTARAAPATAPIYATRKLDSDEPFVAATVIRVPGADALPDRLSLDRAFKPFLKRYPSRRLKHLDTSATAEASAERKGVTPVFRPLPERWFDVVLLVEQSDVMEVWADTIRELEMLLSRHGAFRNVRVFRYAVREGAVALSNLNGQAISARAAVDPEGRRLCLFVTNGASAEWRGEPLIHFARSLGSRTVTAIVQMLPERAWSHTPLGDATEKVYALAVGAPNRSLQREDWLTGLTVTARDASAVPMFALTPKGIEKWARAVMTPKRMVNRAVNLEVRREPLPAASAELSVPEKLAAFRSIASKPAFQLLRLLSAAPLTLPVMRLVQQSMQGPRDPSQLAEVFLSGLIERSTPRDKATPLEQVFYDFVPGAREMLSGTLSSREADQAEQVLQPARERLREFVEKRTGQVRDFAALLADPAGLSRLPASARAFVEVSRRIYEMRGLVAPLPPETAATGAGPPGIQRVVFVSSSPELRELRDTVIREISAAGHIVLDKFDLTVDYSVYIRDNDASYPAGPASLLVSYERDIPRLLAELQRDPPGMLVNVPLVVANEVARPQLEAELAHFLSETVRLAGHGRIRRWPKARGSLLVAKTVARVEVRRAYPGGIFWDCTPELKHPGNCLVIATAFTSVPKTYAPGEGVALLRFVPQHWRPAKVPNFAIPLLTEEEIANHFEGLGVDVDGAARLHRHTPLLVTLIGGLYKSYNGRVVLPRRPAANLEAEFESLARIAVQSLGPDEQHELFLMGAFSVTPPPFLLKRSSSASWLLAFHCGWTLTNDTLIPEVRTWLRRRYPNLVAEFGDERVCRYFQERAAKGDLPDAYWPNFLVSHAFASGGAKRVESLLRDGAMLSAYLRHGQQTLCGQLMNLESTTPFLQRMVKKLEQNQYRVQPTWENLSRLLAPEPVWPVSAGVADAHRMNIRGKGIRVAVPGGGCNPNHPELRGLRIPADMTDLDGSGTEVCSVIAGLNIGVAPGVDLHLGPVLSEPLPDILCFTLSENRQATRDMFSALLKRDVLVITSQRYSFEGDEGVLVIGMCDSTGKRVSSTWHKTDLNGYGLSIPVATGDSEYSEETGAAYACAYVCGIAALYAQATGVRGAELRELLIRTADPQTKVARFALTTDDRR